jgi:hypothetical protein
VELSEGDERKGDIDGNRMTDQEGTQTIRDEGLIGMVTF